MPNTVLSVRHTTVNQKVGYIYIMINCGFLLPYPIPTPWTILIGVGVDKAFKEDTRSDMLRFK